MENPKREPPIIENINVYNTFDAVNEKQNKDEPDHSGPEEDYKIDKIFYRISNFCMMLGVNFYRERDSKMRCLSLVIVALNCCLNLYFAGYVAYLTFSQPFESVRVATSISMCTWVIQATSSTLFLAHWQSCGLMCSILDKLYEANKGVGIHQNVRNLSSILKSFFIVLACSVVYTLAHLVIIILDINIGYLDKNIALIFGDRHLFIIVQLSMMYTTICWAVAMFVYSLLIHSTNYEFEYFNGQVQSIKGDCKYHTDEELCSYLLKLMKIHNRLTECVKLLDKMFNRYAFVMIATIIPNTIFSLFMIFRRPSDDFCLELLFAFPLILFCGFCFYTLVNPPSQLHNTIYNTKSALCANTQIWFPYRPNVYHSALAFVCHLDQTNLGVSIWGFAVVSKPLVLTTMSVMMTCLALFIQIGDCNNSH